MLIAKFPDWQVMVRTKKQITLQLGLNRCLLLCIILGNLSIACVAFVHTINMVPF